MTQPQAMIWKHPMALGRAQRIDMPRGARILTVQLQDNTPTLWTLCDPEQPLESRVIITFGTGHTINLPPGCKEVATAHLFGLAYIGTFQQGPYVWHVFEERGHG